ncbi:anti-sigma factor, partial [Rhizobiaceae bacterium]|nr:anti-sigma factor [Rhizobiaceae bacterium]
RVSANDNRIAVMQRSRGRWRAGALAAGIAACVLGALAFDDTMRARFLPDNAAQQIAAAPDEKDDARVGPEADAGNRFVAVVTASGDQPALVVTVDTASNEVSVRALGVDTPPQKSLQLWYVADGADPVSLGLVGNAGLQLPAATPEAGSLLAVSVEPVGGSTTGGPSGPVVYSGKLVLDDSAAN